MGGGRGGVPAGVLEGSRAQEYLFVSHLTVGSGIGGLIRVHRMEADNDVDSVNAERMPSEY